MFAVVLTALAFSGPSAFNKAMVDASKVGAAVAAVAVTAPAFAADLSNGEAVFQGNCAGTRLEKSAATLRDADLR